MNLLLAAYSFLVSAVILALYPVILLMDWLDRDVEIYSQEKPFNDSKRK